MVRLFGNCRNDDYRIAVAIKGVYSNQVIRFIVCIVLRLIICYRYIQRLSQAKQV